MDKPKIAVIWVQDDVLSILVNDRPAWTCQGKRESIAVAALLAQLSELDYATFCEYDSEAEYLEHGPAR